MTSNLPSTVTNPSLHDPYPRDPMFWEYLDGDIEATAVAMLSGRAIYSDLLDLELGRAASYIGVATGVTANTKEVALADAAQLREWMRQNDMRDSSYDFIHGIPNIESIFRDEECREHEWALEYGIDTRNGVLGANRLPRAVGALLWGGEHLVDVVTKKENANLDERFRDLYKYASYPYFQLSDVEDLLASRWRLDAPVGLRELLFTLYVMQNRFDLNGLPLSEVIHALAEDRHCLLKVGVAGGTFHSQQLEARKGVIDEFRAAVDNLSNWDATSALLWFCYYDQSKSGDYSGLANGAREHAEIMKRVRNHYSNVLNIARHFPLRAARPFMDVGVWDVDLIAAAIENGVAADTLAATIGVDAL